MDGDGPLPSPAREAPSQRRALAIVLTGLVLAAVVRRAFATDDAYITFRTVDNVIHGYGLTWNVAERVQAFTSPLWMMLVAVPAFVTREVYNTSFALQFLATAITVYVIVTYIAVSSTRAILCVGALFL